MITAPAVNEDGSTIPWAAGCANTTASYQRDALQSSGAQVVLWLSGWESADHRFNGQWLPTGTPQGDAALVGEIEASVDRLAASGAKVVLLTYSPNARDNDRGIPWSADQERRIKRLDELYRQVEADRPGSVLIVYLEAIVCPGGVPCPAWVDGVRLRPLDGGHFGPDGAAWVAPRLVTAVTTGLRGPSAARSGFSSR
jgi:hypothetical protein